MTGNSLHIQWPLTSELHGSVSQREQLVFRYGSNSTPNVNYFFNFQKTAKSEQSPIGRKFASSYVKSYLQMQVPGSVQFPSESQEIVAVL
jgi:hypothetical protein